MPELPEVETMVRGLRAAMAGRRLVDLEVLDDFLLDGCTAESLANVGRGATVEAVDRRGKWAVIRLASTRGIIVIQPRMTGGFQVDPPTRPEHIRLIFRLKGSPKAVWFCDARRLGKIAWHADEAAAEVAFARSHGPDALKVTLDQLTRQFARTNRGIKPTLLDQKVVAGIGNIYADEILHRAGIHPERIASGLSPEDVSRIHAAIAPILEQSIELEGSSFDGNYRTILGREGGYLRQSLVHLRKGEPCRTCEAPIVKERIAGLIGRPTYYCPSCQSRPDAEDAPPIKVRKDRVS